MDGGGVSLHNGICPGVIVATDPQGLRDVTAPTGVGAALWLRRPAASFQEWIDGLDPAQLPSARVVLTPETVPAVLTALFEAAGTPEGHHRDRLRDDIAVLARLFATVTGVPYLRLRLDVVTTDACRKFHLDAVTLRLVCTYRGPGTQYGAAARPGTEPAEVFAAPTGAPILIRGSLWPGTRETGLRHRSPPIEGSGVTRLVLVLDPLTGPDGD